MRAEEFENPKDNFVEMFRKFLPLAMKIIGLNSLPKMVFEKEVESPEQPTFGQYVNNKHILHVGLANRHPNDILRTIAHELVHYKQDTENKLNDMSGATGSPQENEAHAIAGVVMRNFNKRYPEYLKTKPIISESQLRSNDIENVKFDNDKLDDLKSKYLPDWEMLDHKVLQAKYVAKDHRHAEEFIEFINKISEKMDHFAEVTQDVAEVSVKTTTFDVKGLTILDFKLALMVDKFAQKNDIEQVRMSGNFGMYEGTLENNKSQYIAALYVDEFADGDHWYIKGTPDVIQRFVQLANSLEDEAVKGTEYEPGVGMMAKIHKDLGDDSIPQWKIVSATNLEQIKPITGASLRALMTADLSDGAGEFMSEFLWNLEEKGQALVHDGSEQSVSENFDKEAEAWRDWQLKMLPRKMEMLSKLVKGWVPSKDDHYTAIEAGYDAMIKTGNVNDAAKAISDTFKEIQRQQGVTESDGDPKSFTNNGLTWTLEHLGSIDGKDLGSGGLIDIFKGYQDINNKGKFRWFIRGQRTGVLRPVSSEHTAIRKFLHPNVANNDEYKKFTEQGIAENLINEAQTFDFDGQKQTILTFVKNVLNNRVDLNHRGRGNIFYALIVGDGKVGGASKLGLPDTFAASWKKYFQNPAWGGGAPEAWSQINLGDQFAKATGDDRTLNFYITVDKEKNNIEKFLNTVYKLANYLQPISQQYQTPIKFKTHSLLDNFIGHNDSLKVYYYDPKVKDLVVNATRKWLSDSGITTGARSHEHGVDVKSGGGSFGQILSNHVYDTFTKLIQTNKTKYTPEQYFEWLKQHLPSLIQQVKQKEVAENFADGRNPQDKGDSARHGIRKGMTLAQLKKVRSSDSASPRKKQLAHWQINMRQGQKKNESAIDNKAEGYLSKVNKLGSFLGSFVDIPSWDKSGSSKVVRTVDDRVSVLIKIGGINIPFYCSTGEGGKVTVPTGKWYPFFGFGPGGWMNKGSEKSINAFYGSGIFKTYANVLNLRLGDLRNDETVPYIKKTGRDVFNQDMLNPQDNVKTTDDANLFKKRINSILAKTGSDPFYVIENKKP